MEESPATPETVEDIVRRLADVQDRLLAVESGDFRTKYELEVERDRLRELAATHSEELDASRPTDDIRLELAALETRLQQVEDSKIDLVMQAGGGTNAGSGADGMGAVVLNQQIAAAGGVAQLTARIARLRALLDARAED